MAGTTSDRVLAVLEERDVGLPEDGLTLEKIGDRAFGFQFEPGEALSFRIERHPTMYLSDMGLPGLVRHLLGFTGGQGGCHGA